MRSLLRLVTPPGGETLDPFCGSGSTGCAVTVENADPDRAPGWTFTGIEREAEYVAIAQARPTHWAASGKPDLDGAEPALAGMMSTAWDISGVRAYRGDARKALQALPAASAQTCVTSPTYFGGLRDYGRAGQPWAASRRLSSSEDNLDDVDRTTSKRQPLRGLLG